MSPYTSATALAAVLFLIASPAKAGIQKVAGPVDQCLNQTVKGSPLRAWLSSDSLAVRYFAYDPESPRLWTVHDNEAQDYNDDGIIFSPDESMFFVISHSDDLDHDRSKSLLWVFSYGDRGAPKLERKVLFDGGGLGIWEISRVEWDADGAFINFLGYSKSKKEAQGYRLNISTGEVEPSASLVGGVTYFTQRAGNKFFYNYSPATPGVKYSFPLTVIKTDNKGRAELASQAGGEPERTSFKLATGDRQPFDIPEMSDVIFSPGGRYAIFRSSSGNFSVGRIDGTGRLAESKNFKGVQGLTVQRLNHKAFWTSEETHVILVGVQEGGAARPLIALVDAVSGAARKIAEIESGTEIRNVFWNAKTGILLIREMEGGELSTKGYRIAGKVIAELSPLDVQNRLAKRSRVRRSESVNRSPRIEFVSPGGRILNLTGCDSALKGVRYNTTQAFEWTDADGEKRSGGLILPHDYVPGKPIPIIVEAYDNLPQYFRPDGPYPTALVSQTAAARGYGVITVGIRDLMNYNLADRRESDKERPAYALRIETLVDALVSRGITKAELVSNVGFSRGGFLARYLATHPTRTRFASTVIADSFLGNYNAALYYYAVLPGEYSNQFNGGRNFWNDPAYWMEMSEDFNADRVETPILNAMTLNGFANSQDTPWQALLEIGAYNFNKKPNEYVLLPDATHQLGSPRQRSVLMDYVLDWVSYWTNGEKRSDPALLPQYARWDSIRLGWQEAERNQASNGEPGFINTRSGMAYRIDRRRPGESAKSSALVQFSYAIEPRGHSSDAALNFSPDLLIKLPPNASINEDVMAERSTDPVEELGKGWDQILRVLHEGEEATVLMPAGLAQLPGVSLSGKSEAAVRVHVSLKRIFQPK